LPVRKLQLPQNQILLTLNIGNALLQDLLKDFGVLKFLLYLGDNAFRQFLLLTDLYLALISDPRIKNCLGFRGKSGGLLKLVCFGFKLGCFLTNS
jgi:hypothetical protein